jgi:hypothetical protein
MLAPVTRSQSPISTVRAKPVSVSIVADIFGGLARLVGLIRIRCRCPES